jgi:hypothetical protein
MTKMTGTGAAYQMTRSKRKKVCFGGVHASLHGLEADKSRYGIRMIDAS